MRNILLYVAIFLIIFYGIGLAFKIAAGFIHIVLIVAVILFVLHFIRGNRSV